MTNLSRVFIIGHPGAGKSLIAKRLAEKMGWKYVNADFELEYRIGRQLKDIVGNEESNFNNIQSEIISSLLKQENIVVTTDASIADNQNICEMLANNGLVAYVQVSLPIQLERLKRNPPPFLIANQVEIFLEKLHQERDKQYEKAANIIINSDDSAVEDHVLSIQNFLATKSINFVGKSELYNNDKIFFHKTLHVPIYLSPQQANCLKLLAHGKSAKEIAKLMNISNRTVEGYIAKLTEILGCSSSKELINLYHDQPDVDWCYSMLKTHSLYR